MTMRRSEGILILTIFLWAGCGIRENPHEKKGDNYFSAARYEDAFAEYAVALKQMGDDPDLLRKMGRTSLLRRDLKGTRNAYFSLLRLSPDDVNVVTMDFFRLGIDFFEEGDDPQMASAFESLFEVDPTYNIGEYNYYLADYYYDGAEFEKAAEYYTSALRSRPEHEKSMESTYRLAFSNEKIENYHDALVFYEQYVRKFPKSGRLDTVEWHRGLCALNVAREEFDLGNASEALAYVEIPLSTGQPQVKRDDAWHLKGEIYLALGEPDSALTAYQKVLELNPSRSGRLVAASRQRIQEIKFGK